MRNHSRASYRGFLRHGKRNASHPRHNIMILFDAELHVYTANGVILPSVTQVLKRAGLIDDRFFTSEARERGSAVHTLCERYAQGERKDNSGRNLSSLEYVGGFTAWMEKTGAYLMSSESIVSHTINGKRYAGKFDGLYWIDGKRVLVDIKTGAKSRWHKMQLAAYSMAYFQDRTRVNPDKCISLYVKADNSYRDEHFTGAELVTAIDEFREALEK